MQKIDNRFYLVVIADYNDDDAHGIVHDNVFYWFTRNDLGLIEYDRVNVSAFNTVETGYILARRALNPLSPSRRQVFFVNTAPRMDKLDGRKTNEGEGFVWAELKNGKHVFAVNSGHTLSFIKPEITRLRLLNVPDNPRDIPQLVAALAESAGSGAASIGVGQFRSGYIYPIMIAQVLARNLDSISPQFDSIIGRTLDAATIPDIPDNAIVYRDGYGNLKTSIKPEDLIAHQGQSVGITINGRQVIANVRSAIFDVPVHHFSFAPGSTVLSFSNGTHRQFVELVQRGGNAALAFAHRSDHNQIILPKPGDQIAWRAASEEELAP